MLQTFHAKSAERRENFFILGAKLIPTSAKIF